MCKSLNFLIDIINIVFCIPWIFTVALQHEVSDPAKRWRVFWYQCLNSLKSNLNKLCPSISPAFISFLLCQLLEKCEEIDTLPWRVEYCFLSTRMCAFHITLFLLLKSKWHSYIIMHFSFVKHRKVSKCKVLQVHWDEGIESSPAGKGLGCTFRWETDPEPTAHAYSPESQP